MAGMHRQTERRPEAGSLHQCGKRRAVTARRVRVLSGVELDCSRAEVVRAGYRIGLGRDEEARPDARVLQPGESDADPRRVAGDVEPAFGGDLLAAFGNESDLMGSKTTGQREHLVGAGHLEVEHGANAGCQPLDVGVLNVPSILAEVRGDAVGAGLLAQRGRRNGVGFVAAPCLTYRRHVIDVDVQPLSSRHIRLLPWGASVHFISPRPRDAARTKPEGELAVRKLTALVFATGAALLLAACGSNPSRPSPQTSPQPATSGSGGGTGAADARSAVLSFISAAQAKDLQAMSAVWGSVDGSVRNTNIMSREEMERRELIMMCYLDHQTHQILSEAPSENDERKLAVEFRRGALTRTSNFYAVAGPGGRWYVRQFDIEPLGEFCRTRKQSGS